MSSKKFKEQRAQELTELVKRLEADSPKQMINVSTQKDQRIKVVVAKNDLINFCKYLQSKLGYDQNSTILGIDRKDNFEVVYNLTRSLGGPVITVVVTTGGTDPAVNVISCP